MTLTYPPEPASQLHELMASLHKQYNSEVSVITSVPSYPIGKIYSGFKNVFDISIKDGVKIYRGPVVPSQSKSLATRFLYYLSNFVSTIFILFFRQSKKDEIYIIYQPPVSSFLAFYFFQIFKKRKFIFWINDMWPETLINYGINNFLLVNFIEYLYKKIYKRASKIIVISRGFKDLLIKKGVDSNKIEVIYNWYSGSKSNIISNKSQNTIFKLLYTGNLGKFQNLETALIAVQNVQSKGYPISFEIFGQGTEFDSLNKLISRLHLNECVKLRGRIEHDQVFQELINSDSLFVQLIPNDLFSKTIPHKIYEYMASGRPILGALQGDAAEEIINARCGIVCKPNCPTAIAESLIQMLELSENLRNNLGKNGQKFVFEKRNLNSACQQFYSILTFIQS